MAYTAFNPDLPDGSVQNGPQVVQSIQDNQYALWTSLAFGMLPAFSLACSGGTAAEPTTFLFTENGSPGAGRVRGVASWSGGYITQIVWTVSQDSGGAYSSVGTSAFTYDGSGNVTACTGVSGLMSFVVGLLGRLTAAVARIVTLESGFTGLGSMSLQDADGVAIIGGTITNTVLGGIGSDEAQLAYVKATRDKWIDLSTGTPANTFTLDFAAGNAFKATAGNNFTFAVTNEPANGFAQKTVLEVYGGSGFTATLPAGYTWGGAGAPTWTAGPDLVTVYCRSHASTPVKRFILSSLGP